MTLAIIAILLGFFILIWSADRLIAGSASLANNLGIPPLLIGLTIIAFGTSAPEIMVAIMASVQGNPGIAIGNAIGSNIANIGLVLGASALLAPINIDSRILKREYPLLLFITLLVIFLLIDGELDRVNGSILTAAIVLVTAWFIWLGTKAKPDVKLTTEIQQELPVKMSNLMSATWIAISLILLPLSSKLLVMGAVEVAKYFGISDLVIGLTIIAIGTSLPELTASTMSILKNEDELAVGNILGSNIFNSLAVLAMPGLIAPGPVDREVIYRDLPVMFAFTLALFLMSYGFRGPGKINRWKGLVLFTAYCGYLTWLVIY